MLSRNSNRLPVSLKSPVFGTALTLSLLAAAGTALARATNVERLSVASTGMQGHPPPYGTPVAPPSLSANGRFVAFTSYAHDLVPDDPNTPGAGVFVRDRLARTTERVSVFPDDGRATRVNASPSISADGRFVAFVSNLATPAGTFTTELFLRDRVTRTTMQFGPPSSLGLFVGRPALSADGRTIVFAASAAYLDPGGAVGLLDIFAWDRVTGATERISVPFARGRTDQFSHSPSVSADGRFVAFTSYANNLVLGQPIDAAQLYVRDRRAGTTERVSLSSTGEPAFYSAGSASITPNGRYVVFDTNASNLAPGGQPTGSINRIYVRDRWTRTTERVSLLPAGEEADVRHDTPSISADGRYVAFMAGFLVFVRDRARRATTPISLTTDGAPPNHETYAASISADGRIVAFASLARNLVPGDTNEAWDTFVAPLIAVPTGRRPALFR